MKRLFITLLLLTSWIFQGQANEFDINFTNQTMRIDYVQTGTADTAILSLYKIKKEPYWGGNHKNLLDTFRYGEFFFEVMDSASGKVIYSRGYSTLFAEWQTTSEAKELTRSFHESIIFPYPKHVVQVKIYRRNWEQAFVPVFSIYVDPEDPYIEEALTYDFETQSIHQSGNPSEMVDVVIIPEGYTSAEMDKFLSDTRRFMDSFFKWDPFSKYPHLFNIHLVMASSIDSGTDIPETNQWRRTVLESNFFTFGSERYLTVNDFSRVRDVAALVPYDQIVIMVNTEKYGGGGIYNFYSVFTSDNPRSEFVFLHEFGHGFASLADEYYESDVAYSDYFNLEKEPYQPNITTLVNFEVKWKKLIPPGTPIPTPAVEPYIHDVGVFEGGGYVAKGIYRPTFDSSMKSSVVNAFGPVNSSIISQMIQFVADR